MKRTCLFMILLAILISYSGCQKPGCLGSAGAIAVQERPLPLFDRLAVNDNIDLVLIQSDTEKMEITAPENIIPNIQAVVTDQLLTLNNQTDCRWLRDTEEKIVVKLYFRNLTLIEYSGSGNISNIDTLRLKTLRLNSELGAGNIELTVDNGEMDAIILKENASMILHGKADRCATYTNARGILDLSDLAVKRMYIIYSGLADTYVQVSDELDATIRYKGNLFYKGDPVITRSDYFSSGRLIKAP